MILINENIPKQNFEIVKETIGAVLKTELDSQKAKQTLTDNINVYIERSSSFSQSENLMINVLLDSANYSFATQSSSEGGTVFFIDIYTSSKEKEGSDGGENSAKKRDLYLGMIRYILESTRYRTLNLPAGAISGTSVDSFENFLPPTTDTGFVKMCRVTFSVRINENQKLWEGIDINSIFTDIKLSETDQGYKFQKQNN